MHVAKPSGSCVVATLEAGRFFGERALITGEVRNATIVARIQGIAYTLDKLRFDTAIASVPSLQEQLRQTYFAR